MEFRRVDALCYILNFFLCLFATQQLTPIFFNYTPKWACAENRSEVPAENWSKNCTIFHECPETNLHFEAPFSSAVQEFRLLCGPQAYNAALMSTIQFLGVFFGAFGFGQVSDSFGRKRIVVGVMAGAIAFGCLSGVSTNWEMLAAMRFLTGCCVGGVINVAFTYAVELILPRQRLPMKAFTNWGWSRIIMTLICYLLPYWRHAFFAQSLACLPGIFLVLFLLPESPKCLSSYANDLNSRNLGGNFWVTQFAFASIIAFSAPFIFFIDTYVPKFNRRHLHQIPQFFIVVDFLVMIFLLTFYSQNTTAILIMNVIGTCLLEFTWTACYLCAAEGFPTVVRSIGIGTCNILARIGSILAPQMTYLANLWLPAPFATVAVVGTASLVISWRYLPDTKGLDLKAKFDSVENNSNDSVEV